jgi:hypothetical protein
VLFNAYRRSHVGSAVCSIGAQGPRWLATCVGGLELHHRIVEFAMQNGIDLPTFAKDFLPAIIAAANPLVDQTQIAKWQVGLFTQDDLMAWAESDPNFQFLCEMHHRGHSGVHVVSASDWNGVLYVPGMAY